MTKYEIESYALQLSATERARLTQRLIASLDDKERVEQTWAEEAVRRGQELSSKSGAAVPGDQVFTDARKASE